MYKHFQTGPMEKEQLLAMYLNYPRDQLPDNLIFLGLRYEQRKDFVFESRYTRQFLQAKLTFGYLGKEED